MVFDLPTPRSHEIFSAFMHVKYRHFCSDNKREHPNRRKIGSVARKIKKSIMTTFFSINLISKIFDLRYEKMHFSSQKHCRGSFDNENWKQYQTFLFYTLGLQSLLSMRKVPLLLKNGKTQPKNVGFWGSRKICFAKRFYGGLLHCKTWILVINVGTLVHKIKVKSVVGAAKNICCDVFGL